MEGPEAATASWDFTKGPGSLMEPAMDLERITVDEAKRKLEENGYVLLDVRSLSEFSQEHPEGAYNIPFLHKTPQGMIPNRDFGTVVQSAFPNRDQPIVTTCEMGGRSARAARELMNLGYTKVVDLKGGFTGERDDAGNLLHEGWKTAGYPVAVGEPEGRAYRDLSRGLENQESPVASSPVPSPDGEDDHASIVEGMNRFASRTRRVNCVRLGRELPGLKRRPYPGELGQRIFDTVSAQAWDGWVEHSKMIINEYRIHAADPEALRLLMDQCEQFLFGGGVTAPEGYVPE